jgi:hypothetical protein
MQNAVARKLFRNRSLLPKELSVYRTQLKAFRRKFGRAMRSNDPFFFDPDAETPRYRTPEHADDVLDLIGQLMVEAGIDSDAIYAFKRTRGLFPTAVSKLTEAQWDEWNIAIEEYHLMLRHAAGSVI